MKVDNRNMTITGQTMQAGIVSKWSDLFVVLWKLILESSHQDNRLCMRWQGRVATPKWICLPVCEWIYYGRFASGYMGLCESGYCELIRYSMFNRELVVIHDLPRVAIGELLCATREMVAKVHFAKERPDRPGGLSLRIRSFLWIPFCNRG
jgi:hypothetical protein